MKYGKRDKDKDLTTLHYNDKITLTGIPLEAYDYIVNGKPVLDWVVERQCVKTDKGQRHRQRLGDGNHEKSPLPAGTIPASHHGQP